jgi:hypothetical protein
MDVPELATLSMPGMLENFATRCFQCNSPNNPIQSKPTDSIKMKEAMKRQKFFQNCCGRCGMLAYCSKDCQVP